MMNNDMLQKIEYLREKADVSYDEAMQLLERNDGDIMRALIALEKQGRVYGHDADGGQQTYQQHHYHDHVEEARQKADSFFKKASKTRVVVEKNGEDGDKKTVANVSAPIAACVLVFAPHFTLAAGVIALITGHQFRVKKEA